MFLGGHDHLCSALPVGAFREGSVMNITGTWETIGLITKTPPLEALLGGNGIMRASEVIAVGGAVRNRFWMQNKADVTGLRVRVPEVEEATVPGAAILAGIGAGIYQDAEDAFAKVQKKHEIFEPNGDLTTFYQKRLPMFQNLYEAMKRLQSQPVD